jgi:hypothetical protein
MEKKQEKPIPSEWALSRKTILFFFNYFFLNLEKRGEEKDENVLF